MMRTQIPSQAAAVALLVAASLLATVPGCSRTRSVATAPRAVNSHGLQKLTPQQVDAQIRAVQASPTLPESAKPNIIASIRAQGAP